MNRDELLTDPKEEIVELITDEMQQIKRKLNEIKQQIDQTQTIVDREQQRSADIATDLRNIQDNLDTVPRQDIKAKYDEALDSRFRLATMRGQLEKFQAHYEYMEKQQQLLNQLLGKLQGVGALSDVDDPIVPGQPAPTVNFVRIIQAQEDERQRLSVQMHDGPAQSLTNFILQAEICQKLFDRNPERAAEELNNLKTAASTTFQKVRDFIFDLRPMMLTDLGVVPTVRRYVDSFKDKTDIETELEILGDERRLESHREVMVFRSIQELMGHVRDYAGASHMKVRLDLSGSTIKMLVEDDGRGFNPEPIFSGEEGNLDARTQGLMNLKERIEMVGGSIAITSDESSGSTIRLELPAG
jgi:two-component system sensor histidine kinase DegS